MAQEWHGYFFHVSLISPLPSPTILKLRAQLNYNRNILEALNLCCSGKKSVFHVNPYVGYLFLKLPACPEFMEYNVTSFGRHQKNQCHETTEKSGFWHYNEEVWQDQAIVISPQRFISLTSMRAHQKPELTGSDHQAADHQIRRWLLSHSCMSVADIMSCSFRCWCVIASASKLSKNWESQN